MKSSKQRRNLKQLHADLAVLGCTGSSGRVAAFAWAALEEMAQGLIGANPLHPVGHCDGGWTDC